jgi:hypothetical protein
MPGARRADIRKAQEISLRRAVEEMTADQMRTALLVTAATYPGQLAEVLADMTEIDPPLSREVRGAHT